MSEKKRGLGRGLEEMLSPSEWLKRDDMLLFYCPIEQLEPNPYQPRQTITDERLEELVHSIQARGVLQPILVSRTEANDRYQILAGERRWRAAGLAGLSEVPVLIRDATPDEALEVALIENIQRQDLNCIEEALAYQRLYEEFHLTQEEIARRVGKNRSTVANLIRLLNLPPDIQEHVLNEKLSMGHARALLAVAEPEEQLGICDIIFSRHLSVRQTEQLIAQRQLRTQARTEPQDPRWEPLTTALQSHFGSKRVKLRTRGGKGVISLAFRSEEELKELLDRMGLTLS